MKLIAQIKLQPTTAQFQLLKQTLEQANKVCNRISAIAWHHQLFRQFNIHAIVYKAMRAESGLAAQVVVRCIAKVADAYKLDHKTQRYFKPLAAIAFDDRILSYHTNKKSLSIWTIEGRQKISFLCGEHQAKLLQSRQGESDLVYYKGDFYLLACCEIAEPTPQDIESVLGVDFGIVQIATDSLGASFSGETIEAVRQRYQKLRQALQSRGTKSARRHLKKLAKKEARFRKDTNHCISKQLVKKAKDTKQAIALEDLKGIGSRTTVRKPQRARHSSWAYHQLRAFILYKALIEGVRVILVDPRNSSRQCAVCEYIDKRNRQSQAEFCCVKCGHKENADLNAAKNIGHRAIKVETERPQSIGRLQSVSSSAIPATGTASSRYTAPAVSGSR